MMKVFLDELPRKGASNVIDWFKSNGYIVKFIYNDIEGWVEIADVKREGRKTMIGLKYLNYDTKYMFSGNILKGQLGEILRVNTSEYYYNIGDIIEVSTGKIKIKELSRDKDNKKEYIFECLECGWDDGRINEGNLKKKQGCGCCANRVPVLGINTIYDTDPWMIPYFINPEITKTKTFGSNDDGLLQCPICKTHKNDMMIVTLHRDKDIRCEVCSDGFSYGEKYTYSLLKQLELKIRRHKVFDWSKNIHSEINSLCGNKEYDFYICTNNEEILIETNGIQHYEEAHFTKRSLYEEQENDKLKEIVALKNKIKEENYIVIDCRYSDSKYIKNSILNNYKIINKFNLTNIDWNKCEQDATNSYLVEAVKYYNKGMNFTQIAVTMDIYWRTVSRYIRRANRFGLCKYNEVRETNNLNYKNIIKLWEQGVHNVIEISEELELSADAVREYLKKGELKGIIEYKKHIKNSDKKPVKNIEYGKEFISINEAHKASKNIFGIDLSRKGITKSCDTGQAYKGLHFHYI